MAEAQVFLIYKSWLARILYWLLLLGLPAYGMFCLWFSFALLMAAVMGNVAWGPALIVTTAEFLVGALLIAGIIAVREESVILSRDGISVPFIMLPSFRFRTELSWNLLNNLRYFGNDSNGKLVLFFDGLRRVTINLRQMSKEERDKLLVALEVWSGGSERFPQLEDMKIAMGNAAQMIGCTEMWEEELARRFAATNFIPLEPGQKLQNDNIQVVRQMAFGGLSAIYLVQRDGQRFVLKESVVPPDADQQLKDKAAKFFNREADLLSKIKHENIVRVVDHFVENGRDYLVIDYVPGSDLRKLVKERGAPDVAMVIDWADQIAQIVSYLHARTPPILHRDLTPDNLILRDDGQIVVIDFGAANLFVGTATGTMIGKQAYIAPEQLRGKASTKSDVYAYGCTLYFLLTGRDPEALSSSRPSEFRSDVPPWLDTLIAECTNMEETERPSIEDVAQVLRKQYDRVHV